MPDKPTTAAGYKSEQVELVRTTCLYVATKLAMYPATVAGIGPFRPDSHQTEDGRAHIGCRSEVA
jgi:hypothetical protein